MIKSMDNLNLRILDRDEDEIHFEIDPMIGYEMWIGMEDTGIGVLLNEFDIAALADALSNAAAYKSFVPPNKNQEHNQTYEEVQRFNRGEYEVSLDGNEIVISRLSVAKQWVDQGRRFVDEVAIPPFIKQAFSLAHTAWTNGKQLGYGTNQLWFWRGFQFAKFLFKKRGLDTDI